MSDLEMTKTCALVMGVEWCAEPKDGTSALACYLDPSMKSRDMNIRVYDPLHDDAQAMALVKRFELSIRKIDPDKWDAWIPLLPAEGSSADLNRAIVECVAKMHATK